MGPMFDLILETFTKWLGSPGVAMGAIIALSLIFAASFLIVFREITSWFVKTQGLHRELRALKEQLDRIEEKVLKEKVRATDQNTSPPAVSSKVFTEGNFSDESRRFVMSAEAKKPQPTPKPIKRGQFLLQ